MYSKGKSSSLGGKHSVTASGGKSANSTGAKVTASAGKNSGTNRNGDPKGCSPMGGKGK
jgi:hypothetical protein